MNTTALIDTNESLSAIQAFEVLLEDGNQIVYRSTHIKRSKLDLVASKITFKGKGNTLFIDGEVSLRKSSITFNGDESLCYLSGSNTPFYGAVSLFHDSVFFLGKDFFVSPYGNKLKVVAAEAKSIMIGEDCLFSNGIILRSSDAHALYDLETGLRINQAGSILIGDHVWVGEGCSVLKGSVLNSGSVLGAGSVLAGKSVPANSAFAGNPARHIKDNVAWQKPGVNKATKTLLSQTQRISQQKSDCRNNATINTFTALLNALSPSFSTTASDKLRIVERYLT